VIDDDVGTNCGHRERDSTTDTRAATGDQGDAILKSHVSKPLKVDELVESDA